MRAYLVHRQHAVAVLIKVVDDLLCVLEREASSATREDGEQLLGVQCAAAVGIKGGE